MRWWLLLLVGTVMAGCGNPGSDNTVVVYCALDREFSEPVLQRFESQTGIRVLPKYDTESTKSVGLTEQIRREEARPICDVFWNNEPLNTLRLAEAGALEPYTSPVGQEYSTELRSPEDLWYGFAARVRVLLVNTQRVAEDQIPKRLEELTDPAWRGQVAIAKPLFGTTATHVACLFARLGPEPTREWLRRLEANEVKILPGNKQVAVEVGAGRLAMGLTDTDDSLAELRAGRPVRMVYLDQGADELGVLVIPNTVARVRDCPHPDNANRLIDFLLSPEIEGMLALGKSGQIPLHPRTTAQPELGLPAAPRRMAVDLSQAVHQWDEAMKFVKEELTAP